MCPRKKCMGLRYMKIRRERGTFQRRLIKYLQVVCYQLRRIILGIPPIFFSLSPPSLHIYLHIMCTAIYILYKIYNIISIYLSIQSSLVAQLVKNPPAMQETWVWSPGWEDTLEEAKVTHSSILAWRIPWTEVPGGLQSMGLQKCQTRSSH